MASISLIEFAHSWWEEEYYACRGVARSSSKIVKSIIFIPLFASISQKTLSSLFLSVAVSEYLACSISIWKPWSFRKKIAAHMRWSLWVNSVFPRSHTKTNARCSASAYLKSFMEFFTPFFSVLCFSFFACGANDVDKRFRGQVCLVHCFVETLWLLTFFLFDIWDSLFFVLLVIQLQLRYLHSSIRVYTI